MSKTDGFARQEVGRILTRRWNDPATPEDGFRLLVTRYRPRGVPREGEPWDAWDPTLGPSKALHAAAYGKDGAAQIAWDEYTRRYHEEMSGAAQVFRLRALANRVAAGESITLLCSSACEDETRCHRTLLRQLVLDRVNAK